MLIAGAALMVFAGVVFSLTKNFWILTGAAILGVISPSGKEVGPFLPIEQAALSQTFSDKHRTRVFAWYNLVGSVASALGALAVGISGSGPTVFALVDQPAVAPVLADWLARHYRQNDSGFVYTCRADLGGARSIVSSD